MAFPSRSLYVEDSAAIKGLAIQPSTQA